VREQGPSRTRHRPKIETLSNAQPARRQLPLPVNIGSNDSIALLPG